MNDTGILSVHCLSDFKPVFSKHSLIRKHFRECYRIWQAVWHGLKWLHQQKWHWWSRGCFPIRIMTGFIIFHDYPWRFTSGILLRGSKHARLTACNLKLSSKLPNIELSFLNTCATQKSLMINDMFRRAFHRIIQFKTSFMHEYMVDFRLYSEKV